MSNAPSNQIARIPTFSESVRTPKYQDMILSTLGDPDVARRFVAGIISAVSITPALQACTPQTILAGALVGESLKLSPNPAVGHYYLVPRKSKEKLDKSGKVIEAACTKATYQTGYKGYIQLALRSGQYKKLNAIEVKQGELVSYNPFAEEIKVNPIMDFEKRFAAPTIGYYVFFELVNGFQKSMYWSVEQMVRHANRYSDAFSMKDYAAIKAGKVDEKDMWKYSSNWYKDFDMMGRKTMIRQLIPTYGPMSIEMQKAFELDEQVVTFDESKNLIPETIEGINEAVMEMSEIGSGPASDVATQKSGAPAVEGEVTNLKDLK